MKTKDFIQLERQLIQDLPGGTVNGSIIVICPSKHVLRGLSFEGSSFDAKTFFVFFFFLPLCVPTKNLYFNFGDRLRNSNGGDVWNANEGDLLAKLRRAISEQALPYLSNVESLENMVRVLSESPQPYNPHKQQAIAYALARLGRFEEARDALADLISRIDHKSPWQREICERAEGLLIQLKDDTAAAQKQLQIWETETKETLKLGSVCS